MNFERVTDGSHYTHVSMGYRKGKYCLHRKQLWAVFQKYGKLANDEYFTLGLAEKPQGYSMLRVDLDREDEDTTKTSLWTENEIYDIVSTMQSWLADHLSENEYNRKDCAILTKKPYIKNCKLKHGYHLQFVNCFISKTDFDRFESEMEREFSDVFKYDKISSKPWLVYGDSKNAQAGSYKVSYVINQQGKKLNPQSYFSNYIVYDLEEKQILCNDKKFYPNVFSILPFNRPSTDFIYKNPINKINSFTSPINYPSDQPILNEDEIYKKLKRIISKMCPDTYADWHKAAFMIKSNLNNERGFQLFRDWGMSTYNYDEDEQIRKWNSTKEGLPLLSYKSKNKPENKSKSMLSWKARFALMLEKYESKV